MFIQNFICMYLYIIYLLYVYIYIYIYIYITIYLLKIYLQLFIHIYIYIFLRKYLHLYLQLFKIIYSHSSSVFISQYLFFFHQPLTKSHCAYIGTLRIEILILNFSPNFFFSYRKASKPSPA